MAVLALCNDFFRDCSSPQEYFDFGLYIPPDVPATPDESGEGAEGAGGSQKSSQKSAPAPVLPPAELDKRRNSFDARAGGKGKGMPAASAGSYAREQGLAPSQADIRRLQEKYGDNVTYEDFLTFMRESQHKEDDAEHLAEFFKYYDPSGTGKLSKKQMKNLLANYGEPLTSEEVDAIFSELGMAEDPVDYMVFVNKLLTE
eukprot:GHVO01021530.1.p1 GENE.GHVO01021530.1~~GHVO01021530.1.p1  ORF type:complete len:201 (-),score=39.82 GHVO01021530.1:95-697(-)